MVAPQRVEAHAAGALDPHGCHTDNRKNHDYHCHRGRYNDLRFRSKSDMLKNKKAGLTADQIREQRNAESLAAGKPVPYGAEEEKEGWKLPLIGKKESDPPQVASGSGNTIVPKGVQQRLRTLKSLHGEGLISDEEYAQKKAEILGDL